jgi:hypothetical protein
MPIFPFDIFAVKTLLLNKGLNMPKLLEGSMPKNVFKAVFPLLYNHKPADSPTPASNNWIRFFSYKTPFPFILSFSPKVAIEPVPKTKSS